MASSNCTRITSLFILMMLSCCGVFGRAVGTSELLPGEPHEATLRTGRWLRSTADRCAELEAPWLENTQEAPVDSGTRLEIRMRHFFSRASRGLVFPGKPLFSFVRRVYRCCQEGLNCRRLKGIQGRMKGDTGVEFVLTGEILSLTVTRAELHLQLSNPQHLDIRPVLPSMEKHKLPTRYTLGSQGHTVELRVDLLFLFHSAQEVMGGRRRGPSLTNIWRAVFLSGGDPPGEKPFVKDSEDNMLGTALLDLGLVLGCSQDGTEVSCRDGGVDFTHTPFMALYFG